MKKSPTPKKRESVIPRIIVSVTMSLDGRVKTRLSRPENPLHMKGVMMGYTAGKSPVAIRVLVNERGNFDSNSLGDLLSNPESLLLLCTAHEISDRLFRQLPPFVRVIEFPQGKFSVDSLLAMLRSVWGVKLLLCEGEPSLLKPLLEADVVEELYLTLEPVIQGSSQAKSMIGSPEGFLRKDRRFRLKSMKDQGGVSKGSAVLHYLRDRRITTA